MKLNRSLLNIRLSYSMVTLILSIYFATFLNLPFYASLKKIITQMSTVHIGFLMTVPLFFFFCLNIAFSLLVWPKLTKGIFSILILVSSLVCYTSYYYGTIYDVGMITNILETNTGEAESYINMSSVMWFIVLGVIPTISLCVLSIRPERSLVKFLGKKVLLISLSAFGIFLIGFFYYQDYASVGRNNDYLRKLIVPVFYIGSTERYIRETYFSTPIQYKKIGLDAKQAPDALNSDKPTLFVFVLGETARTQNYQLNGYPRATNPYLSALDVTSFRHVASCGTATAVSVPCLFSQIDRQHYSDQAIENQDNVLDILQRAGVGILWRENDAADKGVPKRVPHESISRDKSDPLCNGTSCLDMALLENFEAKVESIHGTKNKLVVLHLIGSHGPTYFQRYPKDMAFFQPDCPRSDIENCTQEQLTNTYDNTIRYTDFVVSQVIQKLNGLKDRYNTALMYMSDHGESLGENGLFLHGMPYSLAPKYQTRVPMMVWMSSAFKAEKHINEACLKNEALTGHFSHDNFFDSLLGIMDVKTTAYQNGRDIFARCRSIPSGMKLANQ